MICTLKLAKLYAKHGLFILGPDGLPVTHEESSHQEERQLLEEIAAETHQAKKHLVKKALVEWEDTSADAIADFYKVKREVARALCRGLGRSTAKQHYGNDYECR